MPSHCFVCGHTDFQHWNDYVTHMATLHSLKIQGANTTIRPTRTSGRTTDQIVHALETKLGKNNFFAPRPPGIEDEYVAFMRKLRS